MKKNKKEKDAALILARELFGSKCLGDSPLTLAQKKKLKSLVIQATRKNNFKDLDDFICDSGKKAYEALMKVLPKI